MDTWGQYYWVTANFMLFDRGTLWVLPLTYFYLPKSARAYLFPQPVKVITFAAAPLVLTPFLRNQDKAASELQAKARHHRPTTNNQ